jgi:hypothetical protein
MRSTVANGTTRMYGIGGTRVLGAEYDCIFETCLARAVLRDDFNARVNGYACSQLRPGLLSHGSDRRACTASSGFSRCTRIAHGNAEDLARSKGLQQGTGKVRHVNSSTLSLARMGEELHACQRRLKTYAIPTRSKRQRRELNLPAMSLDPQATD